MLRGFNFSRSKYKIINQDTFIPHIRSDDRASIPRLVLDRFYENPLNCVGLFKINNVIRIKKLQLSGNSFTISMKPEECDGTNVKVLDIKHEKTLLERQQNSALSMKRFIPQYTESNKVSTPIYCFNNNSHLIVGGYYKKDLKMPINLNLNDKNLSAIGLYYAEGGKVDASFTNSWPDAINTILDFMKENFGLEKERIRATIYCNPNLINKKESLEEFWNKRTGVENFAKKLHLGKNSRSPQGTLELSFCSIAVKDVMNSILNQIFEITKDRKSIIGGVLSGDGSPLQQTKYVITHHIPFDKNSKIKSDIFLSRLFSDYSYAINSQNRFILYPTWNQNRSLILDNPYCFNMLNRLRFAHRFLNLPKTKNEINDDKELIRYKNAEYPKLLNQFIKHYKQLIDLELFDEKRLEKTKNAYSLY